MDHIDSLLVQDREVAPAKNEKACRGGQARKSNKSSRRLYSNCPKKLSTARLSAYWTAMMGRGVDHG